MTLPSITDKFAGQQRAIASSALRPIVLRFKQGVINSSMSLLNYVRNRLESISERKISNGS